MAKCKTKIMCPSTLSQFNPETDIPLRHFSTNDVFVRRSPLGNYSLYCYGYIVIRFDIDGYLYTFPTYKPHYKEFVEAYLHEYIPRIYINKVKPHIGKLEAVHLANLHLDTNKEIEI